MLGFNQNTQNLRQLFLASCFAVGVSAQLGSVPLPHIPERFFVSNEWVDRGLLELGGDVIVLTNGTRLFGELAVMPSIAFSFGALAFDPKEVSVISFAQVDRVSKIQIVTRNGQNYMGSALPGKIVFKEQLLLTGQEPKWIERHVDPLSIRFIALGPKGTSDLLLPDRFYTLKMQNGDQLSVALEQEHLHLTDGWRERTLKSHQLVEATFNGGLQGTFETGSGLEEIGFAFVTEPQLSIRIPYCEDHCVNMPWEHVASLQADFGHQGLAQPAQLLADLEDSKPSPSIPVVSPAEELFAEVQPQSHEKSTHHEGMMLVPGGQFYVAISDPMVPKHHRNMLPTANHPSVVVDVPSFYVDTHEITNAEYQAFVNATGHAPPVHWIDGIIPMGLENQPVVNVSYLDARAYADWVGKRLPNEIEWQRASSEATTLVALQAVASKKTLEDQAFSILSLIAGFETVLADETTSSTVFGYLMDDVGGRVAEWTSSPAVAEQGSPLAQVQGMYHHNAEKYGTHQVVCKGFVQDEEAARITLDKTETNETTGFRCVTY